jgi:hypothetical protein
MRRESAFTLSELLVSVAILVALVLLVSRLFVSATAIMTSGNKRMDIDSQVRPLFERFAVDIAKMVRRDDADFFGKGTDAPNSVGGTMPGNDQIAFYSTVPGYYPPSGSQSPVSLVGYRINSMSGSRSFNQLERMSKGLVWNGVSTSDTPIVFLPLTIISTWPAATSSAVDPQGDYELIGPYVFRLEYYYILKNGTVSIVPWDTTVHTGASGLQDVAAISICLAGIDPKSRQLAPETDLATVAATMNDFSVSMNAGELLKQWQDALYSASGIPRPALSAIRLYERAFPLALKP